MSNSKLDLTWENVNALGGSAKTDDPASASYCRAIGDALAEIEKLGGQDPLAPRARAASQNDGGAAFPGGDMMGGPAYDSGMSLRDWFAGQVLIGLTTAMVPADFNAVNAAASSDGFKGTFDEYMAYRAFGIADALLAERAK